MRFKIALLLVVGSAAWAQRTSPSPSGFGRMINPGGGVPTTGGGAGFGRIIYPGTGAPAVARRAPNGTIIVGTPAPPVSHNAHGVVGVVPYPVFYGGGYYDYEAPPAQGLSYGQGYSQGYSYAPQSGDPQQQSPVVIINQNFQPDTANPVIRDYSNVPLPEAVPQNSPQATNLEGPAVMFLIALKDHTIFPTVAYWVQGDTLNYITTQGSQNSVSLDLVDREFSKQLNRERKIDFGLPEK